MFVLQILAVMVCCTVVTGILLFYGVGFIVKAVNEGRRERDAEGVRKKRLSQIAGRDHRD